MAFIEEKIKTEEQKKWFLSFDFRDCLGDPIELNKWSEWYVDKEASLFLVPMGGGSFEIPKMYALMTSQGCIVIQSKVPQLNLVGRIAYSQSVHLPNETILQYVHEALKAVSAGGYGVIKNNEIALLPKPEQMDDFEEKYYGVKRGDSK